ncbi:MAG: hypothetical protein ABIQ35_11835 [Verrucomicrobiota bacterium]
MEFTQVRALVAGRISNARVTAGNLVTGGSTAGTTMLTTIGSLDPIFCYFDADEASVLRYRQLHREGKRMSAMFEKIPAEMALGNEQGFPHKGSIDFVENQLNPATGTLRARGSAKVEISLVSQATDVAVLDVSMPERKIDRNQS